MRLVLADEYYGAGYIPFSEPLTLAAITAGLAKAASIQALFQPGGPLAGFAGYLDQLFGADQAEEKRYQDLLITVQNELNTSYMAQSGQQLWINFDAARANWLLTVLQSQTAIATQKLQAARAANNIGEQRVMARYLRVFQKLNEDASSRLQDAQKKLIAGDDKSLERAGIAIGVGGLALKLMGVI